MQVNTTVVDYEQYAGTGPKGSINITSRSKATERTPVQTKQYALREAFRNYPALTDESRDKLVREMAAFYQLPEANPRDLAAALYYLEQTSPSTGEFLTFDDYNDPNLSGFISDIIRRALPKDEEWNKLSTADQEVVLAQKPADIFRNIVAVEDFRFSQQSLNAESLVGVPPM